MHSVVKIISVDNLSVQKPVLAPSCLSAPLLVDQEEAAELLRINLEEASQLLQVHCGVKPQVRLHGWAPHISLDLVHEDLEVVLNGVHVELWGIEVRRRWGDELGARRAEELLVDWEGLLAAALELEELVAVLLAQGGVDGVIQSGWVESNTDCDQSVHLVVLLRDGIVLGSLLEVLGPRHVDEDVAEHADGIGVSAHHHVGEPNIVVGCEVCRHNARKHGLLVELDVVEGLEREAEVTQQAVDAQETDDREVSQHAVDGLGTVVTSDCQRLFVALHGGQLLVDLGSLNEGVQHVQHAVAAPGVGVVAKELDFLIVVGLSRDLVPVGAEAVELINKFVDDIPCPVVL